MTAPIVYVVDASVAAQVVSPEPLTAQATAVTTSGRFTIGSYDNDWQAV